MNVRTGALLAAVALVGCAVPGPTGPVSHDCSAQESAYITANGPPVTTASESATEDIFFYNRDPTGAHQNDEVFFTWTSGTCVVRIQ